MGLGQIGLGSNILNSVISLGSEAGPKKVVRRSVWNRSAITQGSLYIEREDICGKTQTKFS